MQPGDLIEDTNGTHAKVLHVEDLTGARLVDRDGNTIREYGIEITVQVLDGPFRGWVGTLGDKEKWTRI